MGYKEQRLAEIEAEQIRLCRRLTELYREQQDLRGMPAFIPKEPKPRKKREPRIKTPDELRARYFRKTVLRGLPPSPMFVPQPPCPAQSV